MFSPILSSFTHHKMVWQKIDTTLMEIRSGCQLIRWQSKVQRDRSVIGKHVRNVFKEGELSKEAVWAKFAHN